MFCFLVKNMKDDKFAVIRIGGRQYLVSEGTEVEVDKLDPKNVSPEVLMVYKGGKLELGKPVLKTTVKVKIVEAEVKGEKVSGFKYKSKSRYRKRFGFRPVYTKIQVEKIGS